MRSFVLASSLCALALVGCADDAPTTTRVIAPTEAIGPTGPTAATGPTDDRANQTARIRLVHAGSDAPAVDVYAVGNREPLIRGLRYSETSPYIWLRPGAYSLEIRAAGSLATSPAVYTTPSMWVASGEKLTAVATGLVGTNGAYGSDTSFRVLPYMEAFRNDGYGQATVRLVHASPDAPTLGVDVNNDNPWYPEISNLVRYSDTAAAGFSLPSNTPVSLGLTANGNRYTSFTAPALPAGSELFVIAIGRGEQVARAGDGLSLLIVGPNGTQNIVRQDPVVYTLHASPDAPALDMFFGGGELVDNLTFGELSSIHQMPPSNGTQFDFYPHGYYSSPCPPSVNSRGWRTTTEPLVAGERYLLVASGYYQSSTRPLQLLTLREAFDLTTDYRARVRILHAAADGPSLDIVQSSQGYVTTAYARGLTFGTSTYENGFAFDVPQTVRLGFANTGSTQTRASFDVSFRTASNSFLVAAGSMGNYGGRGLQLFAVNTSTFPWRSTSIYASHYYR